MQINSLPWWRTDEYTLSGVNDGPDMNDTTLWGPQGPGMVQLYEDGKTGKGWGLTEDKGEGPGFMKRYQRLDFNARRVLYGYNKGAWNFAWIMRSARMIAVDIDGKNGGFDHASELGFLPRTVAEISKSGNGYHLFYKVDDDWDPVEGFGRYHDVIGIVQGVDVRGTGCIFHYPTQRWNSTALAELPAHLSAQLLNRSQQRAREANRIAKVLELEGDEIAMLHDELLTELDKPIPNGKRNVTLFAIGNKLRQAEVPDWQQKVHDRAIRCGLDFAEADKLVDNIGNYGA